MPPTCDKKNRQGNKADTTTRRATEYGTTGDGPNCAELPRRVRMTHSSAFERDVSRCLTMDGAPCKDAVW